MHITIRELENPDLFYPNNDPGHCQNLKGSNLEQNHDYMFVSLFCLLAGLHKYYWLDLNEGKWKI